MDVLSVIAIMIGVILFVVIAVCWIWLLATSRRVKTRKVKMHRNVREFKAEVGQQFLGAFNEIVGNMTNEIRCYRCGALSPAHYHGCPYAAQWCMETIAKPGG